MKFRTEVRIPESENKIEAGDLIFSIGSCFSTEITDLLGQGQMQVFNNPFGTLFNPFSINNAIRRLHDAQYYTQEDLITFDGKVISLDHSTAFDTAYAHQTLDKINGQIETGNAFLREARWVLVTYGSAFVHEFLPKNKLVANCHKIPGKFFNKRLLTHLELTDSIYETIQNLRDIGPEDIQVLFTVSPVRHTKDGIPENTLSKAQLFTALHEIIEEFDFCHYLPVYEIMMDDLRDYRFYKEDMVHPTAQAVQYIFEQFGEAYFSTQTMDFIEENFKIRQALAHIPGDKSSDVYQNFLSKINARIAAQQEIVKHPIFGGYGHRD